MPRSRIRGLNSCENLLLSDIEFEMVAAEEEVCHTRKKLAGRAREGLSSCDFVDPRPRRKRSTKPHEITRKKEAQCLVGPNFDLRGSLECGDLSPHSKERKDLNHLTTAIGEDCASRTIYGGPKRLRYSIELRKAFTISAWIKLPLN